jgi:hypothetical protein
MIRNGESMQATSVPGVWFQAGITTGNHGKALDSRGDVLYYIYTQMR